MLKRIKNKNGFTLVELLAVIVILAIIMVITIPTVLVNIYNSKQKSFETVGQVMKDYLKKNYNNCKLGNNDVVKYDEKIFNRDCSLKGNISLNLIANSGYSIGDIERAEVSGEYGNFEVRIYPNISGIFSGLNEYSTGKIINNPNHPDISNTKLVPIKYDIEKKKWVVTTEYDSDWYDYNKQKWANAASIKEGVITEENPYPELKIPDGDSINEENSDVYAMFVWIPRFSYTIGCSDINGLDGINKEPTKSGVNNECLGYRLENASLLSLETPGAIDIKFMPVNSLSEYGTAQYEYDSENRNPTNWYTHPAFKFGEKSLSGIWVGKFETTGEKNVPTILPNLKSIKDLEISEQFATSQKFTFDNNIYRLSGDAHMMKSSEWAAVTYLTQSIYGKYGNSSYKGANKEVYINNSCDYYTGISAGNPSSNSVKCKYDDITNRNDGTGECGAGASTTGNIYGVYDMSGGAYEYLMASNSNQPSGSGFGYDWLEKNDGFYYENIDITAICLTRNEDTIGHGFVETSKWYNDNSGYVTSSYPWIGRGGGCNNFASAGLFSTSNYSGVAVYNISFRSVLVADN